MTVIRAHAVAVGQLFRERLNGHIYRVVDLPLSVSALPEAPCVQVQRVADPDAEPEEVWESWLLRACDRPTFCPCCGKAIWPGES